LDGDGLREVIIAGGAVSNGHRLADGTDDGHSYIYALNCRGQLLWRRLMGGAYTYAVPEWLAPDGVNSGGLLVFVQAHHKFRAEVGEKEVGQVKRFDAYGAETGLYDLGAELLRWSVADLDSDGQPDVLVTDGLGYLHWLRPDLKLRQKIQLVAKKYDTVDLQLWAVQDLDGDGRKEVLITHSQRQEVSYNNKGRAEEPPLVIFNHDNTVLILDDTLHRGAELVVAPKLKTGSAPKATVLAGGSGASSKILVQSAADKPILLEYRGSR
jgi:hypothetical protein